LTIRENRLTIKEIVVTIKEFCLTMKDSGQFSFLLGAMMEKTAPPYQIDVFLSSGPRLSVSGGGSCWASARSFLRNLDADARADARRARFDHCPRIL
jgi:hypothetical protein